VTLDGRVMLDGRFGGRSRSFVGRLGVGGGSGSGSLVGREGRGWRFAFGCGFGSLAGRFLVLKKEAVQHFVLAVVVLELALPHADGHRAALRDCFPQKLGCLPMPQFVSESRKHVAIALNFVGVHRKLWVVGLATVGLPIAMLEVRPFRHLDLVCLGLFVNLFGSVDVDLGIFLVPTVCQRLEPNVVERHSSMR